METVGRQSEVSSPALSAHQAPLPVPNLPNFFIVGAPKTGTTSLYRYLCQHPQIHMSPVKEPCYFASDVRVERLSDAVQAPARRRDEELRAYLSGPMSGPAPTGIITEWADYLKLFQNAGARKAIGEASVCYLWSATAAATSKSVPERSFSEPSSWLKLRLLE